MNATTDHRTTPIRPIDCLTRGARTLGDQYWLFVGFGAVILFLSIVASMTIVLPILITGPLMCGLYLCHRARQRGERVDFDLFFRGFESFVPSLVATAILAGAILVLCAPLYIGVVGAAVGSGIAFEEHEEGLGVVFLFGLALIELLIIAVALVLQTLFAFAYQLIADRGLAGWDAVKVSAQAVRANFWGVLGLQLLNAFIGSVAALMCFFPVLLVMPFCMAAQWEAYRKVFPETDPADPLEPPEPTADGAAPSVA